MNVKYTFYLFILLLIAGCEKVLVEPDIENSPKKVFESMWTTMNEKYALFKSKEIDWNEFYDRYAPQIYDGMNDEQLYDILSNMLIELKDGHTAVWSPFARKSYLAGYKGPKNFSLSVIENNYLKTWIDKDDGIVHGIIENVGYMYVGDFTVTINPGTIEKIFQKFANTEGLIIDVRDNGGGNMSNVEQITKHFFDNKTQLGIEMFKSGPGPDDFTTRKLFIEPGGTRYTKPCVVLINENCFSATNFFVWHMLYADGVRMFGDKTSGGGGHPLYGELPNGWGYRLSSSITYTMSGYNTDNGFYPHVNIYMTEKDLTNGRDPILEIAVKWVSIAK